MELHLVIKYQYFAWNKNDKSLETMVPHLEIVREYGATWWGRINSISLDKAEILKHQIAKGIPTYAYLYATGVPKNVNSDGNLWHVAKIKDIFVGTPTSKHLIPSYYRDVDLAVAFLLEDIKPISYPSGQTPKVPGQAALRYVNISNGLKPENLLQTGKNEFLCPKDESLITNKMLELGSMPPIEPRDNEQAIDLREKIISLQQEVIDLKTEMLLLNEYKIQYQKILNADYLFNSERFLETWLEENIHKLAANLQIIDRQPNIKWTNGKFGRLDLLAMNKETNDLVIIEVKTRKRDKKSSYDQFLRYTTWARKNLDELQKTYSIHGLKPTINLEFMIITDHVDEEMSEICRAHGITLLKIFGGLGFEKVA